MADAAAGPPERWTQNGHYHQVILDAIPAGCAAALDVGCGAGGLTRRLRAAGPRVTGLDRDEQCIRVARGHPGAAGIGYLVGDVARAPLRPESFDLVTSVAMVHHLDAELALRQMAGLLRPGGVLAVVGLARDRSPADFGRAVPASAGTQLHRAGRRVAGAAHWPPAPRAAPAAAGLAAAAQLPADAAAGRAAAARRPLPPPPVLALLAGVDQAGRYPWPRTATLNTRTWKVPAASGGSWVNHTNT